MWNLKSKSKNKTETGIENKSLLQRLGEGHKIGEGNQEVQTSSYGINKS